MNERRIARLQAQIKQRIAEVLLAELADPKLGLVTVTRVELDKEFTECTAYWSVLGDDKAKVRTDQALHRARGFVQREVGRVLNTRTVPRLKFAYDERVLGTLRMQQLIDEVKHEREAAERTRGGEPGKEPVPEPPEPAS